MLRKLVLLAAVVSVAAGTGGCAAIARTSQSPLPIEGDQGGEGLGIATSADGRFVAFTSSSTMLVPGDANGVRDVFVRDRVDDVTARVSVAMNGGSANGPSSGAAISDDGRFVAFESDATNLVASDTNGDRDVFVRDLQLGTTTRVSVDSFGAQADNASAAPSISDDGRYVAYASAATNLVTGDLNGVIDVFVRDRQTGTTSRVSVTSAGGAGSGNSQDPSISGDGRFVAFESDAPNLVGAGADTNNTTDVFVHDRMAATTARMSVNSGSQPGNSFSMNPAISGNGRYVGFVSLATNLVGGDTNGAVDAFVRDRQTGTTERVSVATGGAQANGNTHEVSVSDDGRYVALSCDASNLVPGDSNAATDVFLRDRTLAATVRASVKSGGSQAGGGGSEQPALSDDGAVVAFASDAPTLVAGDTNGARDTFVRTPADNTTERVSLASMQTNGASANPATSANGRYVAFDSSATNLVPRDTNGATDVFVRDQLTGAVERVSVDSNGVQANRLSSDPAISADGRYVVFVSAANNLAAGDTNNASDIYWHDRQTGLTQRVSLGDTENQGSSAMVHPDVSDDGRYIVFSTFSALNAGDSNLAEDVYRRDRATNATVLVSKDSANGPANGASVQPVISATGQYVAFASSATDLVNNDVNGFRDVFRRDVTAGTTIRVSVSTSFQPADNASALPSISDDGDLIAFASDATDLAAGDNNGVSDVFLRRVSCPGLCILTTVLVSVATSGAHGDAASSSPSVDADARYVAFESAASTLVPADTNGATDVLVRDTQKQRTSRVSTAPLLDQGNGVSRDPALSGDGRDVAFESFATNLVDGDTNNVGDVFLRAQPVPTIFDVAPSSHADGGAAFAATITGNNFLPGAQVRFSKEGVTATVNTVTDTTITATFTIAPGTPAGPVQVFVANLGTGPGPTFGTLGRCGNCFAVT